MSRRALVLGLLADFALGEPRRFHPVRGIGALLTRLRPRGRAEGAVAVVAVVGGAATVAALARRVTQRLPGAAAEVVEGLLLKPAFSLRALVAAGRGVRRALEIGDLVGARHRAGRDLVGRPTDSLAPWEVSSAAVESLAENLTDAFVAPLLAWAVGGLPGAWAYRAANTADAMWGHRSPEWVARGWAAARLDDAANLVPSRIAAAAIVLAAPLVGGSAARALSVARRDARRTASPNAGWAMAAAAGALGVRLEKRDAYALNQGARLPGSADVERAERLVALAGVGFALALLVVLSRAERP